MEGELLESKVLAEGPHSLSSAADSRRITAGRPHVCIMTQGLFCGGDGERTLILKPAFALVSMNMTLKSRALASPSSMDTCLRAPQTRSAPGCVLQFFRRLFNPDYNCPNFSAQTGAAAGTMQRARVSLIGHDHSVERTSGVQRTSCPRDPFCCRPGR